MAVFRVEKTRDFTVMSNYHLKDKNLSLKAAGLLSKMLSLPDTWDYTTRGLAAISKEGVDAIGTALKELEQAGYIIRNQLRDKKGRICDTEYIIFERPPDLDSPDTENPYLGKPGSVSPVTENRVQLNNKERNTNQKKTKQSNTHSILFPKKEEKGSEQKVEIDPLYCRELICENIEYEALCYDLPHDVDRLDEVIEIMIETICSKRKTIRIVGTELPHDIVKNRLLSLNIEHIKFVFECLDNNTSQVRNIKQYLLATLFNAPTTVGNYYSAKVNHDLKAT